MNIAAEITSHSDIGNGRSENQDCVFYDAQRGLLILADGMGGHNGGIVASQKVVLGLAATLESSLREDDPLPEAEVRLLLENSIAESNRALYQQSLEDDRLHGMGCTLVVVVQTREGALVVNIGDSRCYHWRQGTLHQVTKDHNLAQFQLDAGLISQAEAETSPHRNKLLRAVGTSDTVAADMFSIVLAEDDVLLTCSDGMTQRFDRSAMENLVARALFEPNPAQWLVAQALAAGSSDNISVQVMRLSSTGRAVQ